jgi:hypothetical protein
MVVVRGLPCGCGAIPSRCPFFWFFFLGKQKKRTNKLAEGIQKRLCKNKNPPAKLNVQIAFVFPDTLSAICVMSIAENAKIFAKDRREEARRFTLFKGRESFAHDPFSIVDANQSKETRWRSIRFLALQMTKTLVYILQLVQKLYLLFNKHTSTSVSSTK